MKASSSPSPFDRISVICFKHCPYLRSFLTELIKIVWSSGCVPSEWKKACTILIHKKGDTNDPSNFRPITLQSVGLKIFTSCLRDSIFDFIRINGFVENKIQKGFTHKVSGTLEHTAMMGNIINKARIKQRSLVITLLDLKNAFGEVHHNLISTVLSYHHVPESIQCLISSLYTNFKTSIITDHYRSPAIPVCKGVLQGDCLSPLLFNMCFNTFIQFIKAEKFKQLGFSTHTKTDCLFHPVHWFQFADDAAVITSGEKDNQFLLNCFTRWCQWANMTIRVDKCTTFGIKKFSTRSLQFQPSLLINHTQVPAVKQGESFRYLGRYFDFAMSNQVHRTKLSSLFTELLKEIDSLPLHPKNKLLLYNRYVLSKVSWHFTVADLSKTWVTENLDNFVSKYIRQWLDLPISATLSSIILSKNQFGLSLILPSVKFAQCQIVFRNSLRSSPNDEIKSLWTNTSNGMNVQYDVYKNTKDILKAVRSEHKDRLQTQLQSQGAILSFVIDHSLNVTKSIWTSVQSKMPKNIFNFTIRYLNNSLSTRSNLKKWNFTQSSDCSFCHLPETLLHVVAGCKSYLEEGRYTWRHNSALQVLANYFRATSGLSLYVDLPCFHSPCIITGDIFRPDLILVTTDKKIYILELTVGFETNLEVNAERKRAKYQSLVENLKSKYKDVNFVNLSISSLGIFGPSCSSFIEMCDALSVDVGHRRYLISKLCNTIIRTTYYIFCRRNKPWDSPEILSF